jgi:hypothetical protein
LGTVTNEDYVVRSLFIVRIFGNEVPQVSIGLEDGETILAERMPSYRKLAGILTPLTDQKRLDLNTTIQTKTKDAYQRYKTFTGRQAEKARHDWMEGLINGQQHKENEDRYRQSPNEGSSPKVKKRIERQQRAMADIQRQMVL